MTFEELTHSLRKEAVKKGHSVQTVVSGYSMFPFLRKGDLLTVEPVPMETIKRGDVVVFERQNTWIAHRVIRIRQNENNQILISKGDTNFVQDEKVSSENYIGVVFSFERNVKKIKTDTIVKKIWTLLILQVPFGYAMAMRKILVLSQPV